MSWNASRASCLLSRSKKSGPETGPSLRRPAISVRPSLYPVLQGLPAGVNAIAAGAPFQFVEGVNLPKGRTAGIAPSTNLKCAPAAIAHFKFVDGVNLPKGRTAGIALGRDPARARRVRRVEHQLPCDPHKQVLAGDRLDVPLSPGCGAVMRGHLHNDAGALVRISRRIHNGDVNVVIVGDVRHRFAAVYTLSSFLPGNENITLQNHLIALA